MRLHSVSIALLGLPVALAAVVATHSNAFPTRPDAALRVPDPSPQPTAVGTLVEEAWWQAESTERNEEADSTNDDGDELLRLQKRDPEAEPEALPTVMNTFTHVNKTATSTKVKTITSTKPLPAGATEIAVFTADGVEFTVTSINGVEAVDGKILTAAGPAQDVGGDYVSEGTKGSVLVNGQVITFGLYSSSSSYAQRPASSSAAASGSSSSVAAGAAGPHGAGAHGAGAKASSGGAVAPVQTAAANVAAFVGAVVGAMVL